MRHLFFLLGASGLLASGANASLTMSSGLGTTHTGNLVANGSFEIGAPPDGLGNALNWADPSQPAYGPIPSWTGVGPNSNTRWGNDSAIAPYRLKFSDVLPDGRAGVFMGTTTNTLVSQAPTFLPNGSVTFASTPSWSSVAGAPVRLTQTVFTNLTVQPSYNLSFWVSGEENSTNQGFTGAGIMGVRLTNVLAGDPVQWIAVPNGTAYGMSKLYEFTFSPLNPLLPVDITFVNWGGVNLAPYGGSAFGTQPILDDVIVNAVPAPSALVLFGMGSAISGVRRRRR
jgi:hypothetical protein